MPQKFTAKFGLSLSTRAVLFDWATMDDIVNAACVAEQSGCFDSVWVGDNLLSKPRVEAIVTLSAIAARTERVKLGTICLASFPFARSGAAGGAMGQPGRSFPRPDYSVSVQRRLSE